MKQKLTCVVVDDEPMAREILVSYIDKVTNLDLVNSFENATDALVFMQENKVDLYFLDINMPEITGLSLAKIINNKAKIIFTTAYRDYAVDGFNLNVIDYLLKPFAFDRFLQAIEKVKDSKTSKSETDFMFVRANRKMIKVDFNDILYVESLSDYVKIITSENTIVTRETISNLEEKLSDKNFLRIHRSYIVSINKLSSYTNEFIEIGNKALPISRSYKESVLQKLAHI